MKRHIPYLVIIGLLAVTTVWGWYNYIGMEMVGRSDVRQACYLTSEIIAFHQKNNRLANESEVADFMTRLHFVETREGKYIYRCGRYARDELAIWQDNSGRFQFTVTGNVFK